MVTNQNINNFTIEIRSQKENKKKQKIFERERTFLRNCKNADTPFLHPRGEIQPMSFVSPAFITLSPQRHRNQTSSPPY